MCYEELCIVIMCYKELTSRFFIAGRRTLRQDVTIKKGILENIYIIFEILYLFYCAIFSVLAFKTRDNFNAAL